MQNGDYDYCIIDPPWDYNDKSPSVLDNQLTYELWKNDELRFVFENLKVNYIFMWVTNSMIEEVFKYYQPSEFVYKTLITWVKLTDNDNLFYGLGNTVRNSTEQLMIFARKDAPTLRLNDRTIILGRAGKRTAKPIQYESELTSELTEKGLKGVYIFSGCDKKFIDCVDIVDLPEEEVVTWKESLWA